MSVRNGNGAEAADLKTESSSGNNDNDSGNCSDNDVHNLRNAGMDDEATKGRHTKSSAENKRYATERVNIVSGRWEREECFFTRPD